MAKWTKADVNRLKRAIDSFFVTNSLYRSLDLLREVVREKRREVILVDLRGLLDLAEERATKDEEFVDYIRVYPGVYGSSTARLIERFERLAADEPMSEKDSARGTRTSTATSVGPA